MSCCEALLSDKHPGEALWGQEPWRGDTHLPLATELPHSLWKPALGGVLLHPKCKHGEALRAGKHPVLAGQLPNPAKVLKERDAETPFWSIASLPHTLVLGRSVQNGLLSLPSFLCKIFLTAICVFSIKLPILAQQNGLTLRRTLLKKLGGGGEGFAKHYRSKNQNLSWSISAGK